MRQVSRPPLVLVALLVLAAPVAAQTPLWHNWHNVGSGMAGLGDVNGDGYADIAIFAFFGSSFLASGRDGAFIRPIPDGAYVGLDDIDRDSVRDLGVLRATGEFSAYSGKDGKTLLYTKKPPPNGKFGTPVHMVGDVDKDGLRDVAIWSLEQPPLIYVVHVFSGRDGKTIHRFTGRFADSFGAAVADAGDVDRDGWPDIAVGAPYVGSGRYRGAVFVYSGKTGARILSLPVRNGSVFGQALGDARDFNGDGFPDLLVGAIGTEFIELRSLKDGKALYRIDAWPHVGLGGGPIVPLGDIDGDKVPDFVAGARRSPYRRTEGQGEALVFSGRTGKLLFKVSKLGGPSRFFGTGVAAVGDLNRDGFADFTVAASAGYLVAVSGRKLALHADSAEAASFTRPTQRLELNAGRTQGGKLYLLLGSATGTSPGLRLGRHSLPLVRDAYFDFLLAAPGALLRPQIGRLDALGKAQAGFQLPPAFGRLAVGRNFWHAFVVIGNEPFDFTSNAVPVLIRF